MLTGCTPSDVVIRRTTRLHPSHTTTAVCSWPCQRILSIYGSPPAPTAVRRPTANSERDRSWRRAVHSLAQLGNARSLRLFSSNNIPSPPTNALKALDILRCANSDNLVRSCDRPADISFLVVTSIFVHHILGRRTGPACDCVQKARIGRGPARAPP